MSSKGMLSRIKRMGSSEPSVSGHISIEGIEANMFDDCENESEIEITVKVKITAKGIREWDNNKPYVDLSVKSVHLDKKED